MTEISLEWQRYFLRIAKAVSTKSKDPSVKHGAVIYRNDLSTCSTGFNGLPRGIPDTDLILNERTLKYPRIIHAEANALDHSRECLEGYGLVVTGHPCSTCALRMISKGIKTVYYERFTANGFEERWKDELTLAKQLFEEAGVRFIEVLPE